jgi:hypothetical protein
MFNETHFNEIFVVKDENKNKPAKILEPRRNEKRRTRGQVETINASALHKVRASIN